MAGLPTNLLEDAPCVVLLFSLSLASLDLSEAVFKEKACTDVRGSTLFLIWKGAGGT